MERLVGHLGTDVVTVGIGRFTPHHFIFAYDFGGEESRSSDLQAWIVEGRIP